MMFTCFACCRVLFVHLYKPHVDDGSGWCVMCQSHYFGVGNDSFNADRQPRPYNGPLFFRNQLFRSPIV